MPGLQIYPVYMKPLPVYAQLALTCGEDNSIFIKSAYILHACDAHFIAPFQTQAVLSCRYSLLIGQWFHPLGRVYAEARGKMKNCRTLR